MDGRRDGRQKTGREGDRRGNEGAPSYPSVLFFLPLNPGKIGFDMRKHMHTHPSPTYL